MRINLSEITKENLTAEITEALGILIGLNWSDLDFSPENLLQGMLVEYEHGTANELTNVTNDDPILTAKIALAHLNEKSDYYKLLKKIEG